MASESWTVQSPEAYETPTAFPGQVFRKDQLPDPQVQKDAGIDPEGWLNAGAGTLYVEGDETHGLTAERATLATED